MTISTPTGQLEQRMVFHQYHNPSNLIQGVGVIPLPTMTALRAFSPLDLFKMNLTNLDPLTENYDLHFYFQYLAKWPSLFTVAEGQQGEITGYSHSAQPLPPSHPKLTVVVAVQ